MSPKKKTITDKPAERQTAERSLHKDAVASSTSIEETDAVNVTQVPDLDNAIFKRSSQLTVVVLALGWLFDFLFWKHRVGVSFSIFLTACLLGGGFWLLINNIRPAKKNISLLVSFLFFAIITFLRMEPLTIFLAFTFTLLSVGLFGSSYIGGRWYEYGLLDYISKAFTMIGDMLGGAINYLSKVQKIQTNLDSPSKSIPIWGLLRGFLFALPILLCFGSLLEAGDVVFKDKLDGFFAFDDLAENIFRGILILLYAYLLAGVFIHTALKSKDNTLVGENSSIIKPFLGFTETTVILGSVSFLFAAFVIVQFQYFFGGETNIGVEGYTYSQYARRGFNELVTVAFFSLVLVLGLSTFSRRENETQRRTYSTLSVVLVVLVIVILLSAFQRISLAIEWHGFSRLRLYPRIFLVWLGLLLIAVAFLEYIRKEQFFAFAAVIASVGFAITLTLVNVDSAIVEHNVPRTLQGKNLNVAHLASLSVDVVPALADVFYSDVYPEWVREGAGAALVCYLHFDTYDNSLDDWRSFNLSRWRAHNILDDVESDIQDYSIDTKRPWDVKVRTPSNDWYDCRDKSSNGEE